ncbi:MAG: putative toxin-antitoxin system toxin component, PIN family [Acidobacteria bacterium]|nr:putative toxin-antitoxin system toxin component, PIN family [Acidobacteriota bacterium]
MRAVIDTNVLTGAMLSNVGSNRRVLIACLQHRIRPIVGQALFAEYEDVLSRAKLFERCPVSATERTDLLESLLSVGEWVKIYYSWRPNLPDEGDNHLIELAVAGAADCIVTHNHRHLNRSELRFPGIRILSPDELMEELQ